MEDLAVAVRMQEEARPWMGAAGFVLTHSRVLEAFGDRIDTYAAGSLSVTIGSDRHFWYVEIALPVGQRVRGRSPTGASASGSHSHSTSSRASAPSWLFFVGTSPAS